MKSTIKVFSLRCIRLNTCDRHITRFRHAYVISLPSKLYLYSFDDTQLYSDYQNRYNFSSKLLFNILLVRYETICLEAWFYLVVTHKH